MIYRYKSTLTRPGNATVYAAGDAVTDTDGDPIELIPGGYSNNGRIIGAKLSISNGGVTNPAFRLFFFSDDANVPALTDNSAFAMTAAAEEDLIGYTDFTLEVTGSSGSSVAWDVNPELYIPFSQKVVSGTAQGLYGVLTATAAYNPVGELTVVDIVIYFEEESAYS